MTLPRSTSIVLSLLLLCAGILGGIQIQKAWGTTANAAEPAAGGFPQRGASGVPNAGGNTPDGTGRPNTNAPTTGTIKFVDGTTVYIETADGRTITVNTDANTKVSTATPQTLADLKTGQTITVTGATSDATTMAATSITSTP